MKSVIITGANGFLGSYLVKEAIASNFTPIALVREGANIDRLKSISHQVEIVSSKNFTSKVANLIKQKNLNPEFCIHSAWAGIDSMNRSGERQISINLPMQEELIKFCKLLNVKNWIGIGSLTEHGNQNIELNENSPICPVTAYAKAKVAACWISSVLCEESSINWTWVRLGPVYGIGDNPTWLIPYIIQSAIENKPILLSPSQQLWDYLHIEDAAKAIFKIVETKSSGVYNLGSNIVQKIETIATSIVQLANSKSKIEFGAKPYGSNQTMLLQANIDKLKKNTGWTPTKNFKDSILQIINSNNQFK